MRLVSAPDSYRSDPTSLAARFANDVREAVRDMRAYGIKPAGLLLDTIFSSDGVFTEPPGFLRAAVDVFREAGGIFIADEVQAGFGRTGSAMWGFARHGIVPDIVTMGKPMGNGHPVAGLVAKPAIDKTFGEASRYFNTFGGNTVSCAVGMAVLDVIENEKLRENAHSVGAHFKEKLLELAQTFELIGDVRGAGLFLGVQLVSDRASRKPAARQTAAVVNAMRERRVLISATGPGANVLKIRPPLIFSRANVDLFVDTLRASLESV